jgi:hypothetical protein
MKFDEVLLRGQTGRIGDILYPNAPQKGEEVGHTTYGPWKKFGRNFRRSRIQVILFIINILVHFNVVPERERDC